MKMTAIERLNEIREMCNYRLYHVADKKIDEMYEEFISGELKLSEREENYMFALLDRISNALYLGKEF